MSSLLIKSLNFASFNLRNTFALSSLNRLRCLSTISETSDAKNSANLIENQLQQQPNEIISQSQINDPLIIKIDRNTLIKENVTDISVQPIRQAWIENMSTPNSIKLGLIELHPNIFSAYPRPDLIQMNHKWQTLYKHVDWRCLKTRAELSGSNRKPWPQKGTGRARHGSRRAPMWIRGGWATGPRGPKTYFYMLPFNIRLNGLISMLASKLAQNDLHIVNTFDTFPLDGTKEHLEELCETRGWGPSVLFVDQIDIDQYPLVTSAQHFHQACESINHINILPVYGLNVFSMLKHETLVLTIDALKTIEERLIFNMNRIDLRNVVHKQHPNKICNM